MAEDVLLVKNIEKVEAEETSYESSQSSGSARIEINLIPPFVGGQNCHRAPFHEEVSPYSIINDNFLRLLTALAKHLSSRASVRGSKVD